MASRRGYALAVTLAALTGGGCGMAHSVDMAELRELPIDQKLLLFHAQNEVAIALDEREQIREEIQKLRRKQRDTAELIADAEGDQDRAEKKRDAKAAGVATLAEATYELEEEWLEHRVDYEYARLDAQDRLVDVARAKLELAKAKLVKRNNIRGAAGMELADFERQVDDYVEEARAEHEAVNEAEKEVEAAGKAWRAKRSELEKASGGALGNPWVEDGSSWDAWHQ